MQFISNKRVGSAGQTEVKNSVIVIFNPLYIHTHVELHREQITERNCQFKEQLVRAKAS